MIDFHVDLLKASCPYEFVPSPRTGLRFQSLRAIWATVTPSTTTDEITSADVPTTGITVQRGHTLDGLGKYYRETIEESAAEPVDVVQVLKDTQADVLVSYLPVGSEVADKFYAQCAIDAGVAFVNALPVFIAAELVIQAQAMTGVTAALTIPQWILLLAVPALWAAYTWGSHVLTLGCAWRARAARAGRSRG